MRGIAAIVFAACGIFIGQAYPQTYILGVVVCGVTFAILLRATWRDPAVAGLRHATISTGATTLVAVIVGFLLTFGADLPFDVRVQLRSVIWAAAVAPALYWLLLAVTGGFRRD